MGLWDKLFPPPNRDKFARIMIKSLRASGETRAVEFDAESFCLRLGTFTFYLDNAYRDYVTAPRRMRGEVLRHYAALPSVTEEADPDFATAKPNILPKLRERFYHESLKLVMRREGKEGEIAFPKRSFSDDLTIEVAYDHPESVQIVHQDLLSKWGLTFDQALAIGRENLWERSKENFLQPQPGLYVSPWHDTYDASRLFLHDLIWQLDVRGQHVAMVPHRNLLLVTGSEDVQGMIKMAEFADEALQQNRSMSGVAVRLQEKQWVPFLPPQESPAYGPIKQTRMLAAVQQYDEQTNLLNALHEKNGEDIFVAKYNAMKSKEGDLYSFAVWVDGATDAMLPRADRIHFGRVDGNGKHTSFGFADWERVEQVAGRLLEPTDLYPVRYRVREFPKKQELQAMHLSRPG